MSQTKLSKYSAFLTFPILLVLTVLLIRTSQGEYYLNTRYDCSYAYMMNSLNLAHLGKYNIGMYHHPGIPVESAGVIPMKIYYYINGNGESLTESVISDPEPYIFWINMILLLFNFISLIILGVISYKTFKSIPISLLIQFTPFSSFFILSQLSLVTPENLLIFVFTNFISICILFLPSDNYSEKGKFNLMVAFSVICGLGLATKITFFPFLFIPLFLIDSIKNKLKFIFFTIVSFFVFILPGIGQYKNFYLWLKDLFFRSGQYGTGPEEIINSQTFFNNIILSITSDLFFGIIYIAGFIVLIVLMFKSQSVKVRNRFYPKLLFSIFVSITILILMTAKHYSFHYMIPALMFKIFVTTLIILIVSDLFNIRKGKLIFSILLFLIPLLTVFQMFSILEKYNLDRISAHTINNIIKTDYDNAVIVSTYGSSNPQYAISFSTFFIGNSRKDYTAVFNDLYPERIFFNKYQKKIYSHSESNDLNNKLLKANKIVFQSNDMNDLDNFINSLKEVTGKNTVHASEIYTAYTGEFLYDIILDN